MKKLFLFAAAALLGTTAIAQNRTATHTGRVAAQNAEIIVADAAAKTNATDTIQGLLNFPLVYADSLTLYRSGSTPFDSGFVVGMNAYGDKGFAERFDFRTGDTSAKVIGVITLFGGTYTAASNKTITMRVWSQGARTAFSASRPKLLYSGFPSAVLASQPNVSIRNLGINIGVGADSFKRTNFASPMTFLSDTFFVGYDVAYNPTSLGGDTIALYSTEDGARFSAYTYMAGTDTIINVKNATQFDDNTWHDNAVDNFQLGHHLAIFPVIVRQYGLGVDAVTKNGLSWYGHYPNPATNVLNVKMSLAKPTDVTVFVMSMDGRMLSTTSHQNLGTGEHVLPLSTTNLPAGTYTYLVRAAGKDGIASQFTVVR